MEALDPQKRLASDLWLDQPDAHRQIDRKLQDGLISSEQAGKLRQFVDQGYFRFSLNVPDMLYQQLEEGVDRIWKEKPLDLAFAHSGALTSMADSQEARHRTPPYRIADLHSHLPAALDLYLNAQIFSWIDLVFGSPSVAFQSLYFQYGSRQSLHRDPVYVATTPPSHLLAAWIALEDISPDCGPLCYLPGSHKLPYYEFSPGRITIDPGEDYLPAFEATRDECARRGLQEETLTCKKGEVLIWHASLVHGGSAVRDSGQSRRSFVIHYSTRGNYLTRGAAYEKSVLLDFRGRRRESIRFWQTTEHLLERDGCAGFGNPLRGFDPQKQVRRQSLPRFIKDVGRRLLGR